MDSLIDKIRYNGIKDEYDYDLKLHIELTNILVVFYSLMGFILQFTVFSKTTVTFLLLFIPQIFYLTIFLLIKHHYHLIARLLLVILLAIYIFVVSALIYTDDNTNGLVAKLLLGSLLILPFVIFSFREWFWILITTLMITAFLIFYDKANARFNLENIDFNFDNPVYNIFGILTAVILTAGVVIYFKHLLLRQNKSLYLAFKELSEAYRDLEKAKEEITEQNAELNTLNDLLERQKKELQKRNQFFTLLAEKANDAIIIIDHNDKVLMWNSAAEKMFGYSKDEAFGKELADLIIPEPFKHYHIQKVIQASEELHRVNKLLETKAITKDNRIIDIELSINSISLFGEFYYLGIIRDITERKQFIQQLKKQQQTIEQHLKEINESLAYAKYIQEKLLPSLAPLEKTVDEYFLIYKPRDQVSGDFYFAKNIDGRLILAVGDCTGHGLPGSLLTTLAINFLNEIIEKENTDTARILSLLREKIKAAIGHSSQASNEGIDMALIIYDPKKNELKFSGAFLSLYLAVDNELLIYKGDRMPVGSYLIEKDFTQYTINPKPGTMFYMFTDGFTDQIGFYSQTKFSKRRIKKLFLEIYTQPAPIQKQMLSDAFEQWKKQENQIDDVTVLGFRI